MNEELLQTVKLVPFPILFNEYLEVKIGIDNILLFYGFDLDIFWSIDLFI